MGIKLLKPERFIKLILTIGIIIFINLIISFFRISVDLTEDKVFTLTRATVKTIHNVDDIIYIRILLDGEFPAGFKRLQESTRTLLNQFKNENGLIEYTFENPNEGSIEEINAKREILSKDGLVPVNLRVRSGTENSEQLIYPYAILNYGERKILISLLENSIELDQEENLNNSITLLEYKFASAVDKLMHIDKKNILVTTSNGELPRENMQAVEVMLRPFYNVSRVSLDSIYQIKKNIDAVIIAKPLIPFTEKTKFILDQYLMNGGKILWFVDGMKMSIDSLATRNEYIPEPLELNLSDLFFKYGIRIQPNLVLDLECAKIPQVIGKIGDKPQIEYFPWYYHPVAAPKSNHPVISNIDRIFLDFPSSIDTLKTKYPVNKTPLIQSSEYSRFQLAPSKVGFEILRYKPDPSKFNKPYQIMGILLEGVFASNFENRLDDGMKATLSQINTPFVEKSVETKMILVTDGDIPRNNFDEQTQKFSKLGYNRFEKQQYRGNEEFFMNALEYLCNSENILEARSKQYKIRLLDQVKIEKEKSFWQWLNVGLPILLLMLFGLINTYLRKKRYTKNL